MRAGWGCKTPHCHALVPVAFKGVAAQPLFPVRVASSLVSIPGLRVALSYSKTGIEPASALFRQTGCHYVVVGRAKSSPWPLDFPDDRIPPGRQGQYDCHSGVSKL